MLRILETLQKIYAYKMFEDYSTQKEIPQKYPCDVPHLTQLAQTFDKISQHSFPSTRGLGWPFHPHCRHSQGAEFPKWQLQSPLSCPFRDTC